MHARILLFLAICVSTFPSTSAVWSWSALSLEVPPKSEECFYQDLKAQAVFEMDFEVIRGGLLDIEAVITAPNGDIVFRKLAFFNSPSDEENEAEGMVKFSCPITGLYSICFNNRMSRWTPKVVSFALRSEVKKTESEVAKLEHLGPVVDSVISISEKIEEIEKLQHHLRVRETVHMDVQRSTNSRVLWYALAESVILIAVSGAQLYFVRSWFSNSSRKRRV